MLFKRIYATVGTVYYKGKKWNAIHTESKLASRALCCLWFLVLIFWARGSRAYRHQCPGEPQLEVASGLCGATQDLKLWSLQAALPSCIPMGGNFIGVKLRGLRERRGRGQVWRIRLVATTKTNTPVSLRGHISFLLLFLPLGRVIPFLTFERMIMIRQRTYQILPTFTASNNKIA